MVNFIKKTIIVQAVKVAEVMAKIDDAEPKLPHWVLRALDYFMLFPTPDGLAVDTSMGMQTAPNDGWIIQGVDGEIYPCPADVFAASYERYDPDGEETEGLSFNQALSALCSGKKVARKEWYNKRHIEHANGAMFCDGMVDVDRFEASFNSADILALDWYIVTD